MTQLFKSFPLSFLALFRKVIKGSNWKVLEKVETFGSRKYGFCSSSSISHCIFRSLRLQQLLPSFADMGKTAGGFYAVARGRSVGIYNTWSECEAQVKGFTSARYKKFPTSGEAQAFINEHQSAPGVSSIASSAAPKIAKAPSAKSSPTSNISAANYGKVERTIKTGVTPHKLGAPSKIVVFPARAGPATNTVQKRDFSSLKVTEDRVINKRAKVTNDVPNQMANLEGFTVDDEGYVVVFTDGACSKNGRKAAKAGIGVWFAHNHQLNISEPVLGRQTNNTAEIQAAERAIRQAKQNGINKLKVKTDSQFTINCVTKWMNNWKRKNWRLSSGGDVKNKEDLIKLDESMQSMEIKWSYVAGHMGIEGNEAADRLAVAGAERS